MLDESVIINKAYEILSVHEGKRLEAYQDSEGIWTIGVGRNLEHQGLDHDELTKIHDLGIALVIDEPTCERWFREDIDVALQECRKFSWFDSLDSVRAVAILDMMFNMGASTFSKFRKSIELMEKGLYYAAGDEILRGKNGKSKWYRQVGRRAERISRMLKNGTWPIL